MSLENMYKIEKRTERGNCPICTTYVQEDEEYCPECGAIFSAAFLEECKKFI